MALALDLTHRTAFSDETFDIGGIGYRIWEWERQFWANPVPDVTTATGDPVFEAITDTTFALYDRELFDPTGASEAAAEQISLERFLPAVRVAGCYTSVHTPWFKARDVPEHEARLYAERQTFSYYAR